MSDNVKTRRSFLGELLAAALGMAVTASTLLDAGRAAAKGKKDKSDEKEKNEKKESKESKKSKKKKKGKKDKNGEEKDKIVAPKYGVPIRPKYGVITPKKDEPKQGPHPAPKYGVPIE